MVYLVISPAVEAFMRPVLRCTLHPQQFYCTFLMRVSLKVL